MSTDYSSESCPFGSPERITWTQLCHHEPRLKMLERYAVYLSSGDPQNVDWREWENLKARLRSCCGWGVDHPLLGESEAWDTAYSHLLDCFELGKN
jgi:hypothetical protein